MFDQHVLAGNAQIRGTVLHVGRRIGSTHDDNAHIRTVGRNDQLARGFRIFQRFDARCRQQRQRLFENAPF